MVGLVDCNNFFVSCERLFRPDLVDQPTLVLSANDGCVVARSQEVKDIGIPMGVPYFKIKDIIKDNVIQVFSGNITLYRDISRRVFSIIQAEFTTVEQYSIDEAFFYIPESEQVMTQIKCVRDRVWREVGIPVSIGVAASKTQAKYAADQAKRTTGVFLLTATQWDAATKEVQLAQIWGVGRRLAEQYRAAGLVTVYDILQADRARVQQLFGVPGVRLQAELAGEAVYPLTRKRSLQKSLMSSRSFGKTTSDRAMLADAAAYHTRHIAAELRAMDAAAATVRLSVRTSRHGDYFLRGGSRMAQLPAPTNDSFVLVREVMQLLEEVYESDVPYKKLGVVVSDIAPTKGRTESLFAGEASNHTPLLQAIDRLNTKSSKELVLIGSQLRTVDWKPKAGAKSGAYTTRWSDIPSVSAI